MAESKLERDYNGETNEKSFIDVNNACEAIRDKYRVEVKITKKDLADFPRAKVGDTIKRNPIIPDNPKEAFELFKNYYATIQLELQKYQFFEKYKVWNKASVSAEILEIESWIAEAQKKSYANAVKPGNSHVSEYQYMMLQNGYYEGCLMDWQHHNERSITAMVYGRYFLFYDYLKAKLNKLNYQNSKYITKLEIDFEELPKYIIEQGIIQRFEKIHDITETLRPDFYRNWLSDWKNIFTSIPKQYIVKALQKGIEYGKKVYEYHLNNECKNKEDCRDNESWERRIALAENFMQTILNESKDTRKDFSTWIMFYPAWKEIAWRYNTGKEYQQKQDLVAVLWNNYVYYQQKFEGYFEEFHIIPSDYFEKLIFEFRQSFPKNSRVEGVNYFDDLVEQLIERYVKILASSSEYETEDRQAENPGKNKEFTTIRQVLAIHYLLENFEVRGIDNTVKARFIQFLTGKESGASDIKNTTIYKRVRSPFVGSDKKLVEDLQYIRTFFEELGLSEISTSITKEINTKTN